MKDKQISLGIRDSVNSPNQILFQWMTKKWRLFVTKGLVDSCSDILVTKEQIWVMTKWFTDSHCDSLRNERQKNRGEKIHWFKFWFTEQKGGNLGVDLKIHWFLNTVSWQQRRETWYWLKDSFQVKHWSFINKYSLSISVSQKTKDCNRIWPVWNEWLQAQWQILGHSPRVSFR